MAVSAQPVEGRPLPSVRLAGRAVPVALCAAVIVSAIGAVALIGWLSGADLLTSGLPGLPSTKANAAILMIAAGAALGLAGASGPTLRRIRYIVAGAVVLVAGLTLLEYVAGVDLGIDRLVAAESGPEPGTPFPGRMALHAAIGLVAGGLGLVLLGRSWRGLHASELLGLACAAIGATSILGFAYGADSLVTLGSGTRISLPASTALLLLGAGLVGATPEHHLVRYLTDPGVPGQLARRILPAAVLVLPLGGLIEQVGEHVGIFDADVGDVLVVALDVVVLVAIGIGLIGRTARLEVARFAADAARHESEQRVRDIVEQAADGVLVSDAAGRYVEANPAICRMLGYSRDEILEQGTLAFRSADDSATPEGEDALLTRARAGQGLLAERRYRRKDGTSLPAEVSFTLLSDGRLQRIIRDITERKRAEEVQRLAAGYARSLIEASLDPLVTISPQGTITDVNRATEEATGVPRGALIGTDFSDYFTDPDAARAGYQAVLAAGLVRDYPLAIRHVSGSVSDVLYNATVYRTEAGDVVGVFAAARDVTERKRAEEVLRERATLLDLAHDAILVRDPAGRIRFWSKGAERLYGWTAAQAEGRTTDELLGSVRRTPLEAIDLALRTSGEWQGEITHATRDGRTVIVESRQTFERDAESGSVGSILEVNRDVTSRLLAEEARQAAEARFRISLETLIDPFVLLGPVRDASGVITDFVYEYANDAACAYNGVSRDRLIGMRVLELLPEHSRSGLLASYVRVLETGEPLILDDFSYEDRFGGVDDARIFDVRARKVGDRLAYTWRDVTERRQQERRQAMLLEARVKERTAELESFAYSVSHDLRAPIRAIDGFTRIIADEYGPSLDDEGRRLLGVVTDNSARMGRLIDDLLAFARIGQADLHVDEVDMETLARAVADEQRSADPLRPVSIEIGQLAPVRGDVSVLRQVFVNLIGNALKFTRPVPAPRIEIRSEPSESEVVYSVRDNGVGFDPRYADKLFGVFQRLHRIDEFEGTGIGLATVARVVRRHGGRVWAEGAVGQGASVFFALPLKDAAAVAAEPPR